MWVCGPGAPSLPFAHVFFNSSLDLGFGSFFLSLGAAFCSFALNLGFGSFFLSPGAALDLGFGSFFLSLGVTFCSFAPLGLDLGAHYSAFGAAGLVLSFACGLGACFRFLGLTPQVLGAFPLPWRLAPLELDLGAIRCFAPPVLGAFARSRGRDFGVPCTAFGVAHNFCAYSRSRGLVFGSFCSIFDVAQTLGAFSQLRSRAFGVFCSACGVAQVLGTFF